MFFLFSFALCETCQSKCARTKKNDFVSHDALVKFREKFEGYFPFALEMNERLSQRQTLKIKRRTHRQTHTSRTTRLDTVDIYIFGYLACMNIYHMPMLNSIFIAWRFVHPSFVRPIVSIHSNDDFICTLAHTHSCKASGSEHTYIWNFD